MTDVPLDESDIKSCQEFVAKAIEKDNMDLLFKFMERKLKTFFNKVPNKESYHCMNGWGIR